MNERKKCIFRKIEKNLNSKGNKYFASDKNNKLAIFMGNPKHCHRTKNNKTTLVINRL